MPRSIQFLAILCVFFLALQGLADASSPSQDWAYAAIEELGRGRDIPVFEVLTRPNRNQGALLIARLLQHLGGDDSMQSRRFGVSQNVYLDSMIFSYNQRVEPQLAFTASEVELLYRLVLEFAGELEILGYAIQDFKILYAQSFAEPQAGGLFTDRTLLYSEQVLAAARKNAEQSSVALVSRGEAIPSRTVVAELVPEPVSPRNLWTGQFSSPGFLPVPSSFSMIEPVTEENSSVQIGSVEVSGALRPRTANSSTSLESVDASSEGGAGYGISMRVGDVALETAVDLSVDRDLLVPKATSTSLGLSWDWSDLFTLSAGVSRRDSVEDDGTGKPLVTSLGLVVPYNRGQVHLGMTQEWNSLEVGGNSLPHEELAMSASAAELGLTYDFKDESSLRFNYRFIDFSNMEPGTEAEAAFSIKF